MIKELELLKFNSLISLFRHFKDEGACREFLIRLRWGDDVVCPYCGRHHCYTMSSGRFRCPGCGRNFSETVGTIFQNTKTPLMKWFGAMYLISSHKKGISSLQLAQDIEVSPKTAWFMLQKIRALYRQEFSELSDEVECDEAYIGGLEKNKHGSKRTPDNQGRSLKTKTPVFGMVERGGKVVARKVRDTRSSTLSPIIRQFVKPGSRIYTDEYIGYNSLYNSEYTHAVVRHNEGEYATGDAYTNTIEGFWGQLKRMIFGIYHFVSAKYLQRYVDEAVFRYNTREMSGGGRFEDMFARAALVVTYRDVKSAA